jgi:hypothetical protein
MSTPVFVVVGHPNKGKSSIVATLAQDDLVEIAPDPGTTMHSRCFPMRVDGHVLYTLVDTPGFQRPRDVLRWLQQYETSVVDHPTLVQRFVEQHAGLRRAEAVRLSTVVAEHGDLDEVIVGGDFNDDRDASVIYALPGIEHLTPPPTHPAGQPTKLLDHVLLPVGATDVSVTVPGGDASWAAMSDHLPVTVRFTLGSS